MRGGGGQKMSVFVHAQGIKTVHEGQTRVVRIEKQIHSFVFWEKLWLDNFVLRSTDL